MILHYIIIIHVCVSCPNSSCYSLSSHVVVCMHASVLYCEEYRVCEPLTEHLLPGRDAYLRAADTSVVRRPLVCAEGAAAIKSTLCGLPP